MNEILKCNKIRITRLPQKLVGPQPTLLLFCEEDKLFALNLLIKGQLSECLRSSVVSIVSTTLFHPDCTQIGRGGSI